tara:strand:+ start:268 stop:591 length:324 start_codon:yes stop_codon:yes gene_type:complete
MIGLVTLIILIIFGLPKIKATKKLLEALIAILVVSGVVIFSSLDVATVDFFIRDGGGDRVERQISSSYFGYLYGDSSKYGYLFIHLTLCRNTSDYWIDRIFDNLEFD